MSGPRTLLRLPACRCGRPHGRSAACAGGSAAHHWRAAQRLRRRCR
ncbi:hypothetical protein XCR_1572 [Xanthomonas campestris pv. raphani 756C]|nr:hypothetical protein XCR_1572 [Xanthomonas campestris pv. raphani 756C]